MLKTTEVLYYAIHFGELRQIIQWQTWHDPVHNRDPEKEAPSLQTCFDFLDKTSRSFSSVIQELHPELLVPVAVFYLILRGLDTIEDDMTISLSVKDPLLRQFYKNMEKEGWNYDGNGPNEKDRDLLVQFQNVTEEFRKIKPVYRDIIKDITEKMGNGMADYCANAEHNANGVETIGDYDIYCYYVAGLVGNGLTRLFVEVVSQIRLCFRVLNSRSRWGFSFRRQPACVPSKRTLPISEGFGPRRSGPSTATSSKTFSIPRKRKRLSIAAPRWSSTPSNMQINVCST
ncbi:hypothetical protein ABVK25_005585 [Lepraria finkii]|uniref:Squalene synthase n=1 Tax=Lepraria finkii TaxID=1340010 RepID=A0ABR4BB20_9LECA